MNNFLKTYSIKDLVINGFSYLIGLQLIYLLGTIFFTETNAIVITFYSPLGLAISFAIMGLFLYLLSYSYEILQAVVGIGIVLKVMQGLVLFFLGEHFQSEFLTITVPPWTNESTINLLALLVIGLSLPYVNKRFQLAYQSKVRYRFWKFKFHKFITRPLVK